MGYPPLVRYNRLQYASDSDSSFATPDITLHSFWRKEVSMILQRIRSLQEGTVIPKPEATADFKIKGWGTRRGEPALIYRIPNHRSPSKKLEKGISESEFTRAYQELETTGQFTRSWFNSNLHAAATEGGCNYTTIGGIFCLLGVAQYGARGEYTLATSAK